MKTSIRLKWAAALTGMMLCLGAAAAAPPRLIAAVQPEGKMSPDAARALLNRHLEQFIQETEAMLEARLSRVKAYFDERKDGARPFAKQVLSLDAKLRMTGAVGEALLDGIGQLFGAAPSTQPDSFTPYVRRCFQEKVLDPAKVREALDEAVAGYRGDVAEAEGRLLVALRADIPQDAIGLGGSSPNLAAEVRALALCDALIDETISHAMTDLTVGLGSYIVSNLIGDKVAQQITPKDTSKAGRFAVNVATGLAVDQALEQGIKAMGYDPERDVAARTAAGIDRIRAAIIDGDPEVLKVYPDLSIFRRTHPDQSVRDACRRADEALERAANLGLRLRLSKLRNERYRGLWTALMSHLCGPEAASSPFLMYEPLDAEKCSPVGDITRWAGEIARWARRLNASQGR